MNRLIVEIPSLPYAHRLHGYDGRCSRIHGHNARVTLTVEGDTLDAQGFVCDFYDVKRRLAGVLAAYDHTLLLGPRDPLAEVLRGALEPFAEMPVPPTAEHLAEHVLAAMVASAKGEAWRVVSVRWEEEPGFVAEVLACRTP